MKRGRILTLLTTVLLAVPGFGAARAEQPEMQIGISGGEVLPGSSADSHVCSDRDDRN